MSEIESGFTHLLLDDVSSHDLSDLSDGDTPSNADTDTTSECPHAALEDYTRASDSSDDSDFPNTEGRIGVAMGSFMFLKDIQNVVEALKMCWAKAGKGEAPVGATAAYTNVLLTRATTHVQMFHQKERQLPTVLDIKQRLSSLSCDDLHHFGQVQRNMSDTLEALTQIHALVASADGELPNQSSSYDILESSETPNFDVITLQTTLFLSKQMVLDLSVMKSDQQRSKLTMDGLFCMEAISPLLTSNHDSTTVLTASILLYLLSITHCAYSSVLSQPSYIALPRISALKMANEALSCIRAFIDNKSIFPCQCTNTLGYRMMQMKTDLEAFSKYRCWNALMQSPLIAGNHILEILDVCSYYGMRLFHYRQYVAAVLHSYRALIQLDVLEPVPALEEAFSLFTPVLYTTGVRPESGFLVSWLRYIGARLKFQKGKQYQDHKDTWCMSIPAHVAVNSAGLNVDGIMDKTRIIPKFDYGTVDYTIRMKRQGWVLHGDATEVLDRELSLSSSTITSDATSPETLKTQPEAPRQKARRTRHKCSKSCQADHSMADAVCGDYLKLDHMLNAAFTVDESEDRNMPSSRVNLLSFFHSMTKVVSGISDATHTGDNNGSSSSKDRGKGKMCLCFVQTILRGADRVLDVRKTTGIDGRGAGWSKKEKECIECFKQHLENILKDAKVLDGSGGMWLWSSI